MPPSQSVQRRGGLVGDEPESLEVAVTVAIAVIMIAIVMTVVIMIAIDDRRHHDRHRRSRRHHVAIVAAVDHLCSSGSCWPNSWSVMMVKVTAPVPSL